MARASTGAECWTEFPCVDATRSSEGRRRHLRPFLFFNARQWLFGRRRFKRRFLHEPRSDSQQRWGSNAETKRCMMKKGV